MKYYYTADNGTRYAYEEAPSIIVPEFHLVEIRQSNPNAEVWENDLYTVIVQRHKKGFFIGNKPYVRLGIINADNSARHDWREFQQIKNLLLGPDWEGIELYPAEDRLVDPSNEFFMWCVPKGVLKVGLPKNTRRVLHPAMAYAPQRPFPEGD